MTHEPPGSRMFDGSQGKRVLLNCPDDELANY